MGIHLYWDVVNSCVMKKIFFFNEFGNACLISVKLPILRKNLNKNLSWISLYPFELPPKNPFRKKPGEKKGKKDTIDSLNKNFKNPKFSY
jgi:hypothetical protein